MNVLEVRDLSVVYELRRERMLGPRPMLRAVDEVSFDVPQGQTLALVGESGSGKTSVARAILGLAPIAGGRVALEGIEITGASDAASVRAARHRIQMVFQQPSGSLDPRMRVRDSIGEPLRHLGSLGGAALARRVGELLELVGLDASYGGRYPRQLSGGQRQRVAIARAIAISPSLIICDEPTSALDVSVQAQVLNLLVRLQSELGLSYLFITHDLAVVRQVADTVAVLHHGRLVELGPTDEVLDRPRDPYTRGLLEAVPVLERRTPSTADPPTTLASGDELRLDVAPLVEPRASRPEDAPWVS